MSEEHKLVPWFSERGNPLMWTNRSAEVPIITVENYCKWYHLYAIMPDNTVRKITSEEIHQATDDFKQPWVVDHIFHPRLLFAVAKILGGIVDNQAHEIVTGRWILEHSKYDVMSMEFHPEMEG